MGTPVGPPIGGTPVLPSPGQPAPLKPGEFQAASISNLVSFAFANVGPPSPLYLQRDDQLFVSALTTIGGLPEVVTVTVRILLPVSPSPGQPSDAPQTPKAQLPGGTIIPVSANISLPTALLAGTQFLALAEGYLLSVSVTCTQAIVRGQTFVQVYVARGTSTAKTLLQPLFQDYVTVLNSGGWPSGRVLSSTDGAGRIVAKTVANPAAGSDWVLTVPASLRWRVISWNALLSTSGTVAGRIPETRVLDPATTTDARVVGNGSIPANTNANVCGTTSYSTLPAGSVDINCGLPSGLSLTAGWQIGTLTQLLQGGDQWSGIRVMVEEWIDG